MGATLSDEWVHLGDWDGLSPNGSLVWLGPSSIQKFHSLFGFWKGNANVFIDHGSSIVCSSFVRKSLFAEVFAQLDECFKGLGHRRLLTVFDQLPMNASLLRRAVRIVQSRQVSDLTNRELSAAYLALRRNQHVLAAYDQFGIFTEVFFEKRANAIIAERTSDPDEKLRIKSLLTKSWILPLKRLELTAVLESCRAIVNRLDDEPLPTNYRNLRRLLINHGMTEIAELVENFGWSTVVDKGEAKNQDHYLREISSHFERHGRSLREYVDHELKGDDFSESARRDAGEEVEKQLGLTDLERALIAAWRAAIFTRNEASHYLGLGSHSVSPLLQEIGARLKIDKRTLPFLFDNELVQVLTGRLKMIDLDLHLRWPVCGYWYAQERHFREMSRETVEQFLALRDSAQEATNPSELNASVHYIDDQPGIPASPGRVVGRVCIVRSLSDLDKFQDGDILVAVNTHQAYVPWIQRAGGVITEFGGYTCHAADNCREWGIPAIVGMSGATRKFSDGDRIAIDAAAATVELIE